MLIRQKTDSELNRQRAIESHDTPGVLRFCITHINRDGYRVLTFANQGRNHFDTAEEAEKYLEAVRGENSRDNLRHITDGRPETLAVRTFDCYAHGDAKGIYWDGNARNPREDTKA